MKNAGATFVDDAEYASWTGAWNKQVMHFVWGQLKQSWLSARLPLPHANCEHD